MENINLLQNLLQEYNVKKIASLLNVATGTITRWIELNNIPPQYEFDLLKLSGIAIDYTKYTSKQKDQFFTPVKTAQHCFGLFCETIKQYNENVEDFIFIEPSAGDGSFLQVLPKDNTISMDIEPQNPLITKQDYLDWKPATNKRFVVFGNPPFGLRGHLALQFINHSYEFAEYVCFILPQLFASDGKGVPRKRVTGYNLIYSTTIDTDFYEPNKNEIKVNTIFQIWSKNHENTDYDIKEYTNEAIKIYSMSHGGTVATTRNKNMIGNCDIYIPSTCFGKEKMKIYYNFNDLPKQRGYGIVFHTKKHEMIEKATNINWNNYAFLSTNSAVNLRSSQIYDALCNS
jgi:hypothetical protein